MQHILWIQYVKGPVRPIIGWYCTRKIGGSVVGCCVHIASVLWFLGYDRHQNNTIPSNIRNHQLLDALDLDIPSDTDSDCDSDEECTVDLWCSDQMIDPYSIAHGSSSLDNIVLFFLLVIY